MIQKIDLEARDTQRVELEYNDNDLPQNVRDSEEGLQEAAGLPRSTDYAGTRESLAVQMNQRDEQELLQVTAQNVEEGNITPEAAAEFVKQYPTKINTPGISLEKAAADNVTDIAVSEDDRVAVHQILNGTVNDDIAKQAVVETMIQECQASIADGMNVAVMAGDMVETTFKTQILEDTLDRSAFDNKNLTFTASTEELGEVYNTALRDAMVNGNVEDVKAVSDRIKANILHGLNKVDQMSRLNYFLYGGDEFVDAGGYVEGAGLLAGAAGKVFKMFKLGGAMNRIKGLVKSADKASQIEIGAAKSVTKPVDMGDEISLAGRIGNAVTENVADEVSRVATEEASFRGIYSQDELAEIAEHDRAEYIKKLKDTNVDVVDVNTIEGDAGDLHTLVTIGDRDGKAFVTRTAARKAQVRAGLTDANTRLVRQDGEGFFIQTDHMAVDSLSSNPDEWVTFAEKGTGTLTRLVSGPLSYLKNRFVGGSASSSKHVFDIAATAEGRYAGNMQRLSGYEKSFSKLNKNEHETFNTIRIQSQAKEINFTDDELRANFNATDKTIAAWRDFENLNKEHLNARNDSLISKLHREGARQYNNQVGVKQSIEANKNNPNIIVKNEKGEFIDSLDKFSDDDYYLIKLDECMGDNEFTHVLMPKLGTVESAITRRLIHYRPGGMRAYELGNFYIKIGSSMINPRSGNKINGPVKTITTAIDEKSASKAIEEVKAVLKIAREVDMDNPVEIQKALDGLNNELFKVDDFDTFKRLVKSEENPRGILDPDFEPQVIRDGQRYVYKDGSFSDIADGDKSFHDLIMSRQSFYGERGNLLDSVNGEYAKLVSVEETFDKLVEKAARLNAYEALYARFDEEIARYSDLITNWYEIKNMSVRDKLVNAKTGTWARANRTGKDLVRVRALETILNRGQVLLNARTKADEAVETIMTHVARAVGGFPFRKLLGINDATVRKIAEADPRSFAKTVGFFTAFAGNITQFATQSMGSLLTLGMGRIDKLSAFRCVAATLPYRFSLLLEGTKAGDMLEKAAKGLSLMDDAAWKDFKWLMNEGGGRQAAGYTTGFSRGMTKTFLERQHTFRSNLEKFLLMGMNEGNGLNVAIATMMAVMENHGDKALQKLPRADFLRTLKGKASALSLNMTRVGGNKWQTGKTIIPFTDVAAQWSSFPTRLFEALAGADKHLTARQVAQLHLAAIASMGVAGTYLGEGQEYNCSKWLSNTLGMTPDSADDLARGYLNAMAKPLGLSVPNTANVIDLIPNLIEMFDKGESVDLLGTFPATRSFMQVSNLLTAIKGYLLPDDGVRDWHRSMTYVAKTKNMPSGLKNAARYYIANVDGRYYYGNQGDYVDNLTDLQADLIGLAGMQPLEAKKDIVKKGITRDIQAMYKYCDEGMDELIKNQIYYDMSGEYNDGYKEASRAFSNAVSEYGKIIEENFGGEAANKWKAQIFNKRYRKIKNKNGSLPSNVTNYIEEMYKNGSIR